MKALLAILSYEKANDMVARHFPYYIRSGCDILGVGRVDSDCRFPSERLVGQIASGKDSYVNGDNLIKYHLSTIEHFLTLKDYTHICIAEPDSLFFKPPPRVFLEVQSLFATHVGNNSPGFFGTKYYHGPYMMDRRTAERVCLYGARMVRVGLIECGFPDRWYGLLADLYPGVEIAPWGGHTYSQNRLDTPRYIEEARSAIAHGAWAIHGVKSESELRAVTEGLV